jgi:hypothetical protein
MLSSCLWLHTARGQANGDHLACWRYVFCHVISDGAYGITFTYSLDKGHVREIPWRPFIDKLERQSILQKKTRKGFSFNSNSTIIEEAASYIRELADKCCAPSLGGCMKMRGHRITEARRDAAAGKPRDVKNMWRSLKKYPHWSCSWGTGTPTAAF